VQTTGHSKGVVEAAVRYTCGRWWRTMTATTMTDAQVSLDRFLATTGDARLRSPGRLIEPPATEVAPRWPTVGELADAEPLMALPAAAYPATLELSLPVGDNATVAFRGNRYSVPTGLRGVDLTARHRLGSGVLEVFSPVGTLLVAHRLLPPGMGKTVRTPEHRAGLEAAVLSGFSTAEPCERKGNHPPGDVARTEATKLLSDLGPEVVVDLEAYARIIEAGRDRGVSA
jgi:hypothetical protein